MTEKEFIHHFDHKPKGFGENPATCVACAHTHPELEEKITKLDEKVKNNTIRGLLFIVAAGVITEIVKSKVL